VYIVQALSGSDKLQQVREVNVVDRTAAGGDVRCLDAPVDQPSLGVTTPTTTKSTNVGRRHQLDIELGNKWQDETMNDEGVNHQGAPLEATNTRQVFKLLVLWLCVIFSVISTVNIVS